MRKGETMSAAEREKRRIALKGKPRPPEVVAKLREAGLRRRGSSLSPETRAKMKDAWTRRDPKWITDEFREKSGASRRGKHSSPEHVAKIAAAMTGKKASDETRAALLAGWANNPARRAIAATTMKAVTNKFSIEEKRKWALRATEAARKANPSSLEKIVGILLEKLGVDFIPQHPVGRYVVDFVLPDRMLVIECDGSYWHSLPGCAEKDAARDEYLRSLGYQVLRLSETEITRGHAGTKLALVVGGTVGL